MNERERAMRGRKDSHSDCSAKKSFSVHPKAFVFFDKNTRTQRFEVKARADGSMPDQEAASLLAMHCVMRGQSPQDFGVMVAVGVDLLTGLADRAKKLMDACVAIHTDVQLSQRQHEVLRGVLQSLSNKEIASQLQIGVRTVKFHVSGLLAKFGVADRLTLAKQTRELMTTGAPPAATAFFQPAPQKAASQPQARNSRESPLRLDVLRKQSNG
jgi:DNA-binding NarL/FixJ family response regulator